MSQERGRGNISITRKTKKTDEIKTRAFYNDRFRLKEATSMLESNSVSQIITKKTNLPKLKLPHIEPPENSNSSRSQSLNPLDSSDSFPDLLKSIESLWNIKEIPEETQKSLKSCIEKLPRQKAINLLNHEIKSLKENTSQSQAVLKSIKSREDSLKSIHELNSYLKSTNWLPLKEVHLQCAELLHGHRLFTLNVIESITKWRKTLTDSLLVNNSSVGFIEFKYSKENYLLKLRNDLDFLKNSEFSKILNFSNENDPLLVTPSIPIGKTERGRKRDPNYFVDGGQVIVPIPSFMMSRVKEAEDLLNFEYEYVKFIEENTPEKQAAMFGPKILETIIEEVVNEAVGEIEVNVKAQKKEAREEEKRKNRIERNFKKNADQIIEELILKEVNDIVVSEVNSSKLSKLEQENAKISDLLLSSLIETALKDLEGLSSSTLTEAKDSFLLEQASLKKQKEAELEKLSKEFSASLFEEFLQQSLKALATESLKESRREWEEENSMYLVKSALMEEIGLDFATIEYFTDLEEMRWVPLHLPEELINDVLNEYYTLSPNENKSIMPDIENLLIETSKYTDPCWYWAIKGTLILGLLVFSTDCYNKTGKKILVHHISSLYWNKYSDILASANELVWKVTECDEIRINIFTKIGQDLTPDAKKVFTHQGFKWKTKYELKESPHEITVLGKSKGQKSTNPAFVAFILKCSEVITTSESKLPVASIPQTSCVGNRLNMLHALISLFGRLENSILNFSTKVENKLQETINSLLMQMNETQSFSFPSITGAITGNKLEEFLALQNLDMIEACPKASASVLEVKFRWVSCTNYTLPVKNKTVRYMRFRSQSLKCLKLADGIESYYIPTEQPNIKAFFIKGEDLQGSIDRTLKKMLDLYCFVEKIATSTANEPAIEIWVPCFNVQNNSLLEWLSGYEVVPQQDDQQLLYVKQCQEKISLVMNVNEIPDGLLIANNKYGPVFINDFIFGLVYTKGDKILDIPLFTCLVKEKDWIIV